MAAILASLFSVLIGRMTEVHAPDIYAGQCCKRALVPCVKYFCFPSEFQTIKNLALSRISVEFPKKVKL